jgi:hypothetical protein
VPELWPRDDDADLADSAKTKASLQPRLISSREDFSTKFSLEDVCADDMLAVCATLGVVVISLSTSGLVAAIYAAFQVNPLKKSSIWYKKQGNIDKIYF